MLQYCDWRVVKGSARAAREDAEEIIHAGQGFRDKASFLRVSRNNGATEPMQSVIAYTVKVGEPNTTGPQA